MARVTPPAAEVAGAAEVGARVPGVVIGEASGEWTQAEIDEIEAERQERLSAENRPDNVEVDNTKRTFNPEIAAFEDSDDAATNDKVGEPSEESEESDDSDSSDSDSSDSGSADDTDGSDGSDDSEESDTAEDSSGGRHRA